MPLILSRWKRCFTVSWVGPRRPARAHPRRTPRKRRPDERRAISAAPRERSRSRWSSSADPPGRSRCASFPGIFLRPMTRGHVAPAAKDDRRRTPRRARAPCRLNSLGRRLCWNCVEVRPRSQFTRSSSDAALAVLSRSCSSSGILLARRSEVARLPRLMKIVEITDHRAAEKIAQEGRQLPGAGGIHHDMRACAGRTTGRHRRSPPRRAPAGRKTRQKMGALRGRLFPAK